jgi:hypothetical protein
LCISVFVSDHRGIISDNVTFHPACRRERIVDSSVFANVKVKLIDAVTRFVGFDPQRVPDAYDSWRTIFPLSFDVDGCCFVLKGQDMRKPLHVLEYAGGKGRRQQVGWPWQVGILLRGGIESDLALLCLG